MNRQRKVVITITYNEMGIIIDTKAEEVAQPNLQPTCNQLAICCKLEPEIIACGEGELFAQSEPLSDAYKKAVLTWLLDYQIKAAELKGRYTPYEVLSWVANDWRKEHE